MQYANDWIQVAHERLVVLFLRSPIRFSPSGVISRISISPSTLVLSSTQIRPSILREVEAVVTFTQQSKMACNYPQCTCRPDRVMNGQFYQICSGYCPEFTEFLATLRTYFTLFGVQLCLAPVNHPSCSSLQIFSSLRPNDTRIDIASHRSASPLTSPLSTNSGRLLAHTSLSPAYGTLTLACDACRVSCQLHSSFQANFLLTPSTWLNRTRVLVTRQFHLLIPSASRMQQRW